MSRPNIVLIFTDQLSRSALGAYGNEICRTPTLDRMAADGVVFDRFYANSSLCGPSRFATYTGLSAFYNPNWANPNCAELPFVPYMADLFNDAGYHTGSVGKLHGMPEDFDFGFSFCRHNWSLKAPLACNDYGRWVREQLAQRPDADALAAAIEKTQRDAFSTPDEDYYFLPQELSEEAWLLAETETFLDSAPADRPFLLNLGIQHPHQPWETIPADDEVYDLESIPLPPNFESRSSMCEQLHTSQGCGRTAAEYRRFTARYYTSITQVDKAIGEILATLERRGLADNTIVVVTSDHGEMCGHFGRNQKMCLYEEAIRLPFIVCGAGIPAGQRHDQLGEQVDILPTLLDLAGARVPEHLEGLSLQPAIEADAPTREIAHAWLEFTGEIHAMARSENYKLYRLTGLSKMADIVETIELYNLAEDPWEMHNLWPDPPADPEVDRLRRDFCEYFWNHAGMVGCSLHTQEELLGHRLK